MLDQTPTQFKEMTEGLKKTLLSSKWSIKIEPSLDIDPHAHSCFIDFRIDYQSNQPEAEVARHLFKETEQAIESTIVYKQLQERNADDLIAAHKKIAALEKQVADLARFKSYYYMAKEMRHGGTPSPLAQVALDQQKLQQTQRDAARGLT